MFLQGFQRIPEGPKNVEVALDHMLALQPVPPRPDEQNLVEASLVHGQIKGSALSLAKRPLDKRRPRIGMQVDHVVKGRCLKRFLHLRRSAVNGPHPVHPFQPFHCSSEVRFGQEMDFHLPFQHGVQGPHHR